VYNIEKDHKYLGEKPHQPPQQQEETGGRVAIPDNNMHNILYLQK
jgi:hypothetical protein